MQLARQFCGLLAFGDSIKPSAKAAIERLQKLSIKVAMLIDDNWDSANAIVANKWKLMLFMQKFCPLIKPRRFST